MTSPPTVVPEPGAETYLVEQVGKGHEVDCLHAGPAPGRHPGVRAILVRELCLGRLPSIGQSRRSGDPGEEHGFDTVRIAGVRITGQLNLAGDHLACRVFLTDCVFDEPVNLTGARTDHSIRLTRCVLPSFTADQMHSRSDLELRDVKVRGEVSLVEMHLDGDLRCSQSVFESPHGTVVDGENMVVNGSVHFDDVQTTGTVKLTSAHIRGDFDCRKSRLRCPEGQSLNGTHLTVEGELIWEEAFEAGGEICLQWAHLKMLRGSGASLSAQHGCALDAEGLHVADDVLLDRRFKALGEVRLLAARVGNKLRFTNAILENSGGRALYAERIEVREIYLDAVQASGEIRLVGAEIHTQLNCTAANLDRDGSEYALNAELLVCGGEVYLNGGFTATGEVRLVAAEIKRELNCTRGTFNNKAGLALNADGMTTEGSVFLNEGFTAVGEVRLARATVGRQLDCVRGTIDNASLLALDISGLVGNGDVKLSGKFKAVGTVKLEGARIARDLDCKEGEFSATDIAFDAKEMQVGGSFIWKLVKVHAGNVDISFAFARILKDDRQSWPGGQRVDLAAFTYEALEQDGPSTEDRKTWLKNTTAYSTQPYQHLASIYLRGGSIDDAMEITLASHKDRRKRGQWGKGARAAVWAAKTWDRFIGWTVRYGYQFHRPLLTLLALAVINIGLFYAADYAHNVMSPTGRPLDGNLDNIGSERCNKYYPCFIPPVYAVEILTPVLNLRQITYWLPNSAEPFGRFLFVWTVINIVIGWIASIAIVGGLTYAFGGDKKTRA